MDRRAAVVLCALCLAVPCTIPSVYGAEDSDITAYDLQERCGRRATEVFDREYKPRYQEAGAFYRYESHYNSARKSCVMLVRVMVVAGRNSSIILKLSEVNTRKEFGAFLGNIEDGSVTRCEVDGRKCNSEAEWLARIKPYVETFEPQADPKFEH